MIPNTPQLLRSFLAAFFLSLAACGGSDSNPQPSVPDAAPRIDAGGEPDASPACLGEDDCYLCEPTNDKEFLNHCTNSPCFPFDNEDRLPRYNHGDLPDLP